MKFWILVKICILLELLTLILLGYDLRAFNYGLYFIPLGFMWIFILILYFKYWDDE